VPAGASPPVNRPAKLTPSSLAGGSTPAMLSSVGTQSVVMTGVLTTARGFDLVGPAHNERHAQAAFVVVALASAERRVVRCRRVRAFGNVQAAIVGREHNQSPSAETERSTLSTTRPTQSSSVSTIAAYTGLKAPWCFLISSGLAASGTCGLLCARYRKKGRSLLSSMTSRRVRSDGIRPCALVGGGFGVGFACEIEVEATVARQRALAAEVPLAQASRGVAGGLEELGDGLRVARQLLLDLFGWSSNCDGASGRPGETSSGAIGLGSCRSSRRRASASRRSGRRRPT